MQDGNAGRDGRLEELTAEQAGALPEFAFRWTRIGLCTEPADRPRAEAALLSMYRDAGLPEPSRIEWCGSPLAAEIARGRDRDAGGPVANALRRSVMEAVSLAIGRRLGPGAHARISTVLRRTVERQVEIGVGIPVEDALEFALGAPPGEALFGQFEAGWLSYHHFLHERTPLRSETERLAGLWELARSASRALPHEDACWVCERPRSIQRDPLGRLHSETGPSVRYPDGWEIHASGGVVIPGEGPPPVLGRPLALQRPS